MASPALFIDSTKLATEAVLLVFAVAAFADSPAINAKLTQVATSVMTINIAIAGIERFTRFSLRLTDSSGLAAKTPMQG